MARAALGLALCAGATRIAGAQEIVRTNGAPPTRVAAAAREASLGTRLAWRAKGNLPQLLWTGFRSKPTGGGGEVVIQTSASAELQERSTAGSGTAVFVLKHCRTLRRTDRLPLETRYFDSPVNRVSVVQRGPDLEIVVTLREAVTAVTRKEAGPDGSWFWILKFPMGDHPARATNRAGDALKASRGERGPRTL
jgi:hypothetical protein